MEDLKWSPCGESFDDILKNPKVQLPQLIKLSERFDSADNGESLEKEQVVVILARKTLTKLSATSEQGDHLRLPVECPYKVKLTIPAGKEKSFDTIEILAKSDPLPKFVEVTNVHGVDNVSIGDRLKVVICEKSGGSPAFIHFRSSAGKHIKISINETISFCLAANDSSEQMLSKVAEKSRELPLSAKFVNNLNTPKTHTDCTVMVINKRFTEEIIIASAKKSKAEFVLTFPVNDDLKFQVNNNLKMANDETYRELCSSASNVDVNKVVQYLHTMNPKDSLTKYVFKYKKALKALGETVEIVDSKTDDSIKLVPLVKKISKQEENNLKVDIEQRELVKQQQKEKLKQHKAEKVKLKADKKKEKKERKERQKEEKKNRKEISSQISTDTVTEKTDENMYIMPHSPTPQIPESGEATMVNEQQVQQPQWALHLMKKVKKVRERTRSVAVKSKKRSKLRKEDIKFESQDQLDSMVPAASVYTGMCADEVFTDSIYETLPCEMAYESLDLMAQAQRSFAPIASDVDSGFDEIDQAKINAWREAMIPPPLPGNHPHQDRLNQNDNTDDLYEMAVDSNSSEENQMNLAWQSFYNIVEQSTKEISLWGIEDVTNCLVDLQLASFQQIFSDSQIDGQLLIDLDESVLRDLGLTPFEARKLRKFTFGWRPDIMRPENYPVLQGFKSDDPSQWSESDVIKHLNVIDIKSFAEFCEMNQINGDLLKDICVDEMIMNSIITSKDKKLKGVKIKNYVIDKWRPKKKGDGKNYVSVSALQKPVNVSLSPKLKISHQTSSPSSQKNNEHKQTSQSLKQKKALNEASLGISKKNVGDAPLIARMKQQLEKSQNEWKNV